MKGVHENHNKSITASWFKLIPLCIYSRSKAFSFSWPIVDVFGIFIGVRAELARSVAPTPVGICKYYVSEAKNLKYYDI